MITEFQVKVLAEIPSVMAVASYNHTPVKGHDFTSLNGITFAEIRIKRQPAANGTERRKVVELIFAHYQPAQVGSPSVLSPLGRDPILRPLGVKC